MSRCVSCLDAWLSRNVCLLCVGDAYSPNRLSTQVELTPLDVSHSRRDPSIFLHIRLNRRRRCVYGVSGCGWVVCTTSKYMYIYIPLRCAIRPGWGPRRPLHWLNACRRRARLLIVLFRRLRTARTDPARFRRDSLRCDRPANHAADVSGIGKRSLGKACNLKPQTQYNIVEPMGFPLHKLHTHTHIHLYIYLNKTHFSPSDNTRGTIVPLKWLAMLHLNWVEYFKLVDCFSRFDIQLEKRLLSIVFFAILMLVNTKMSAKLKKP